MIHLLDALFGCGHARETWPRTVRDEYGRPHTRVVCLDCGLETPYDFALMKRGRAKPNAARMDSAEEVA